MEQTTDLIVVRQLPVIEESLRRVKDNWEAIASTAESLVSTEENAREIKKMRSGVRKEYEEIEKQYRKIKADYMLPWAVVERAFNECVKEPFGRADASLKSKADEIDSENKLKRQHELFEYFEDYRESLGLDGKIADPRRSGIVVGLSGSMSSYKKKVKAWLDGLDSDLKTIDALENRDEIMAEYRLSLNLGEAIQNVKDRIARENEERLIREEEKRRNDLRKEHDSKIDSVVEAQNEAVGNFSNEDDMSSPPEEKVAVEQSDVHNGDILVTQYLGYQIYGTLEQLKALKAYLVEALVEYLEKEGINYGK